MERKNEEKQEKKRGNWEKQVCYTWRVNAVKISPDARNGPGWMHKLIKEHILETLGWFKIEEMNPEP